jgi:hypothetical protein
MRGLSRQEKILWRNDCHFWRSLHTQKKLQPTHNGDSMSGSSARFLFEVDKRIAFKFGIAFSTYKFVGAFCCLCIMTFFLIFKMYGLGFLLQTGRLSKELSNIKCLSRPTTKLLSEALYRYFTRVFNKIQ